MSPCRCLAGDLMKSMELRISNRALVGPMTGWVEPRFGFWVQETTETGQIKRAQWVRNPLFRSLARFAQLHTHLDGIDMVFAFPTELDHFIDVMARNPLPSGPNFAGAAVGLPNGHWLSRFPGKGKSTKFRTKAVKFLQEPRPEIREFRSFYKSVDLSGHQYLFDGAAFSGAGTQRDPYRRVA